MNFQKPASFANAAGNISGKKGKIKGTNELLKKLHPAVKQALKDQKIDISNPSIRRELIKIIKAITTDALGAKIGNIKGNTAIIALDMLGSNLSGFIELISKFNHHESGFVGRDVINSEAYYFEIHLGENPSGKFSTIPFKHTSRSVKLLDTQTDYSGNISRSRLLTHGGVNHKTVDIFNATSFMTINELREFTNVKSEVKQALEKKSKIIYQKKGESSKVNKLNKSLAQSHQTSIAKERLYAAIQKFKTTLYINNDMPYYTTYVKIHICTHANFTDCENLTGVTETPDIAEELLKTYSVEDIGSYTRRYLKEDEIFKENLKKDKSLKISQFKYSLQFREGTNIRNTEVFKRKIKILKTITVSLKPSDFVKVDLHHHIPNGIDMFDLYNCAESDGAANTFFIVEATGSNCRLSYRKNRHIKRNGTSPIRLRYELKHDVSYIAHEDAPDKPLIIKKQEKVNEFEDYALWEEFYQSRGEKFHVEYDDIDIDGNNPNSEYILDVDAKTLISDSLLVNLQSQIKQATGVTKELQELQDSIDTNSTNDKTNKEEETTTLGDLDDDDIINMFNNMEENDE